MSKAKTTDEAQKDKARRKALLAWANQVLPARDLLEGVPLNEELDNVVRLVHWLGIVVGGEANEMPRSRHVSATLARLETALLPRTQGQKVATATRLIAAHAERTHPGLLDASDRHVAIFLCGALASNVDPCFDSLNPGTVEELLSKYTNTKDRRSGGGKVTAAGILLELNKQAKWPLGRELSTNGIGRMLRDNP